MSVTHNPPLVLVADDEINTTIMIQRIFEREGYRVERVNDGITALEVAQRIIPDLILLDIRMPGLDGFAVLRLLRENSITAQIPTILVTANAREPADVALGLNLGADDYIYKPFAPQELVARAESKMKARQLKDALHRRTQELTVLLRVSEELNQHLEGNELFRVVLNLIQELLPGEVAAIYQLDEDGHITSHKIQQNIEHISVDVLSDETFIYPFFQQSEPLIWPPDAPLLPEFKSGMALPLKYADQQLGFLLIASLNNTYDESHFRFFEGVGRQVALALHNATLHEIQINYAQHLEDMVAARTIELQSAQQMLVRSEKLAAIGHLASNIAHEINNPLQPITLILEEIIYAIHNQTQIDLYDIELVQENVERIRRIVNQLLEFAGKRTEGPNLQLLDIDKLLEGVRDLSRKLFEKEGMSIVINAPENLPQIYGSKDQLEQVFMNLTLNAQSAMTRGGVLQIDVVTKKNTMIITFTDTGSGIPADQLDKIFDPFYSTKPTGTGLGLFVTYGIIQGHHGVIEVKSKVNVGTTFTLQLPIIDILD